MAGRNDSGGALLGPLGCFVSSVRFVLVFVWRFVCFLGVRFVSFCFCFLVVVSVLFLLLFFCFIFWCSFWFSCSILLLISGVHFVSLVLFWWFINTNLFFFSSLFCVASVRIFNPVFFLPTCLFQCLFRFIHFTSLSIYPVCFLCFLRSFLTAFIVFCLFVSFFLCSFRFICPFLPVFIAFC